MSLTMVSCFSSKPTATSKQTKTVKDSVTVQKQTIDSLLVARKADTVKLQTTIDKLTQKPIVKRSNYTRLKLRKVGNTIEAECIADELKQLIALQKEIISHYKEISLEKQDTIIIPQRYIPALLKPLIWIGGITLAVIIGGLLVRFVKPKFL